MNTSSETTLEKEEIEKIVLGFTVEAQKLLAPTFQRSKKKVVIIAGPTACGKSDLAIHLSNLCCGEIITADSMQVYRGMDIGTAKPVKEERVKVLHHLIDIRDITEPFNVVDFYYEARHACHLIHNRDNTPLVVGGSGFYLHSLIYGPPSGPPPVTELRKALEEECDRLGCHALYERLKELDPQYASTLTKNDKQKIVRGLEIITLTGKKVSKLSWKGRKKPQTYDFRCWFLHRPRDLLYKRIDERCERMLQEGLLEEVIRLEALGLRHNSSASQAIGYKQALDFLASKQTKEDYAQFVAAFKQATRQYAKRQFTWFKREPLFRWLDLSIHDPEIAAEIINRDLEL